MQGRSSSFNPRVFAALLVAAVATAVLFGSPAPARAAEPEMVDNPRYVSWAKYKPGTKVIVAQDMAMGAMTMTNTVVQTLTAVTPDKATVEFAVTINIAGQSHDSKQTQDIPAKVEKGHENLPPDVKGSTKDIGTEKVEVAKKSYDCKVTEFHGESAQGKSSGKVWQTPEIPGGMAKMEMQMESPRQGTIKMNVTDVDLKSYWRSRGHTRAQAYGCT